MTWTIYDYTFIGLTFAGLFLIGQLGMYALEFRTKKTKTQEGLAK